MKRPAARQRLIFIAGITASLVGILIALDAYYLNWIWTGFGPKTLWDWLDLLIIPIVLATGGLWFSRQEKCYEQQIATNRSHDEALQAYLDKMTELLLKEKLRTSTESDEVRSVARARTLTALRRLDKERRIAVLQFLIESRLIEANKPIIRFTETELSQYDLSGASLTGANLRRADLIGADLSRANLRRANLSGAYLLGANLLGANLLGANLYRAQLGGANLSDTNLSDTYLSDTYLTLANLTLANLSDSDLSRANLSRADLSRANLSRANLTLANLTLANLSDANLSDANLSDANLRGAKLEGAILEGAKLEGAILPSTHHPLPTLDKNKPAALENPTGGKSPPHGEI